MKKIVQDQVAANHPGAAVLESPLADAVGLLHMTRRFVVLPDDEALGEFRSEFAGRLGTLEEHPRAKPPASPGLESFAEIVDSKELLERLDASPADRVDSRAFLKARLFDMFIGDFDRHPGNWSWGRRVGGSAWEPIPEDRDLAFSHFSGLFLRLAATFSPRIVTFESHYPPILGLIWNSVDFDRRLLAEVDEPTYHDVVAELQGALTDEAIDVAVRALPPEYYQIDGAPLAAILKARRDGLGAIAHEFYRTLTKVVNVFATAEDDIAEVTRAHDGSVELVLATADLPSTPYFRRRFERGDTDEIRLHLGDGDDRVITQGRERGGPHLHVVGGDGHDVLDETVGGDTRFYSDGDDDVVHEGPGTRVDRRPYSEKETDENGNRPKDWGHSTALLPAVEAEEDIGILLGLALRVEGHGFRADPYRYRHTLGAQYAPSPHGFRFLYEGDLRPPRSEAYALLDAKVSDVEIVSFHGIGNETDGAGPDGFYAVDQRQYVVAPSWVVPKGPVKLWIGGVAKHAETQLPPDRLIGIVQPYGSPSFDQVGVTAAFEVDTRVPKKAAREGARIRVAGSAYPPLLSVHGGFGELHGDAAFHLPLPAPLSPSLALRVGGQRVFGDYPFYEAAFVGGATTVRGIDRQRYAGDASLYGGAELRLRLVKNVGLFGLADSGRVFVSGESSKRWHRGVGGGVWLAFKDSKEVVAISVAHGEGTTNAYVRAGLAF